MKPGRGDLRTHEQHLIATYPENPNPNQITHKNGDLFWEGAEMQNALFMWSHVAPVGFRHLLLRLTSRL